MDNVFSLPIYRQLVRLAQLADRANSIGAAYLDSKILALAEELRETKNELARVIAEDQQRQRTAHMFEASIAMRRVQR